MAEKDSKTAIITALIGGGALIISALIQSSNKRLNQSNSTPSPSPSTSRIQSPPITINTPTPQTQTEHTVSSATPKTNREVAILKVLPEAARPGSFLPSTGPNLITEEEERPDYETWYNMRTKSQHEAYTLGKAFLSRYPNGYYSNQVRKYVNAYDKAMKEVVEKALNDKRR